jgi:hypothetical protein
MATKTDFTEEEWDALQRGVTGAGMLVSLGDRDFTDSFGEVKALAKYLGEQREQSTSTLVRDLAAPHGSGFGFTTSPEKLEAEVLEALRSAVATLEAKAPDETESYRELVLGLANHVANAKGGGVQPGETAAIEKITDALGSG